MTPFRAFTAARAVFLALGMALLARASAGQAVSIAAPTLAAVVLAMLSGVLWSKPRGLGPLLSAALLGGDIVWMTWAASWCRVPAAADAWLIGVAGLAGASVGFIPAIIIGGLAAGAQLFLAFTGGTDLVSAALRAPIAPIAAAVVGFSIDVERRERLARFKAALGSMHRLQVGELFQYALFQVREYMTSVTSVTEALAMQAQDTPLAEKLARLRGLVQECNAKIGRLMDAMRERATSRRAPGEPNSFDLQAVLKEAAQTAVELSAAGPIDAVVVCEGSITLKHDRALVRDLVLTLAQNAVEAAGTRGGRILIAGKTEDKLVCVDVTDEAGGVPDELLGQIFQPLFTTKESAGGLGLGLSMTRRIARGLGGNLDLVTDGHRTTVRLSLPPEAGLPQVFTGDSTWAGRRGEAGKPPQG